LKRLHVDPVPEHKLPEGSFWLTAEPLGKEFRDVEGEHVAMAACCAGALTVLVVRKIPQAIRTPCLWYARRRECCNASHGLKQHGLKRLQLHTLHAWSTCCV
jgi:hypothetical protein